MGRRALLALALTACAHHPTMFGANVPSNCTHGDAPPSEQCMGWLTDRILMMTQSEYGDRDLALYVAAVGARLVAASGDHRKWTFRILDDAGVQAQANPNTTIYVTRGALARLRSEAELAGMLGHEIGHVLAGHSRDGIEEIGRDVPSREVHARDRDDEIQADEIAIVLTARAGYDPHAVDTMLRALAAGDPLTPDPDDVHPAWTERLARVEAFASRFVGGEEGAAAFHVHVAKLIIGDDPLAAAVVDHAIVLARLGIAIDLPAWRSATAEAGAADIELADSVAIDVRTILPALVDNLPAPDPHADTATLAFKVHDGAVLVTVKGAAALQRARAIGAALRPAHPVELAQLHPRYLDLAAPRPLWPERP